MAQLARFSLDRSPELALSVDAATRGWALQTKATGGTGATGSPAGLLLTPAQVAAIAPLAAWPADPAAASVTAFDKLHDQLHSLFLAGDFARLDSAAAAFLKQHPPTPPADRSGLDQRLYQFFNLNSPEAAADQALDFHHSIGERDRESWFQEAAPRMDLTKAQTLAAAVRGTDRFDDHDLLGRLRADLAFSVLAACAMPRLVKGSAGRFPGKYVKITLDMRAHLPRWVFHIDPCTGAVISTDIASGVLIDRVERLAAFQEKIRVIADESARSTGGSGSVQASKGKAGNQATTPGHKDDCDCTCDDPPCLPIDPCCVHVGYYVSELLTLKDETHCYKPSDIAYIENIAPYETRIRAHSFARTVVETSEDETNTSRTEERDHQVTDRFDLQKEIQKNQAAQLDVDAKLSGKIYGQKYELHTSASLSKDSAYKEARDQMREVVDKATLNIQVQTRKLRTRTVTTETAEQNKHKFKNTTAEAAVAKYFWVTQEKKGQVFSSGLRTMVDLLVPSPALLFQHMETIKRARGFTLEKPVEPDKPTGGRGGVTRDNYQGLADQFGLTDYEDPPADPPTLYIYASATKEDGGVDITIPPGYTATQMDITGYDLNKRFFGYARITFSFGGGSVEVRRSGGGNTSQTGSTTLNERNSGRATIDSENAKDKSYIAVRITLTPDPVDLGPWQKTFYAAVMANYADALEQYKAELADYNEALRAYNEKMDDRIKGRHPFACEEIMRTELKRLAIFMMCGEFNWPDVMNLKAQPCGMPWPNRKAADKATNNWYFFDRAFDWNLASFTFYDYFRNPMCKWVDCYEPDETNFLFKAFLRAGYARIQIPVSPGMELDAIGYLETGRLWGATGVKPLDPNDPRWVSVITEIKHGYDCQQNDREGHVEAYPDPVTGGFDSRLRVFTDRYWNVPGGAIDYAAIGLDLDRQIFVDGIPYRIVSLIPDPASPAYNPSNSSTMQWIIGLERKFEGAPFIDPAATPPVLKPYNYAVGAQFVGSPFYFDLPTDLVWIGDQANPCLPCYPIDCVCEPAAEGE